jgi:hypothetical protein
VAIIPEESRVLRVRWILLILTCSIPGTAKSAQFVQVLCLSTNPCANPRNFPGRAPVCYRCIRTDRFLVRACQPIVCVASQQTIILGSSSRLTVEIEAFETRSAARTALS